MKNLLVITLGLSFVGSASADFVEDHDRLFRNQGLCDNRLSDQVQAERGFKKMFSILKKDENQNRKSVIVVKDYLAYSTRLKNESTGQECAITLHDDCYSAYCEQIP